MKPTTSTGCCAVIVAVLFCVSLPAYSAVVFDSLSGALYTGHAGGTETGDSISLAGTERSITHFDFRMRVNTGAEYYFSIYDVDSVTGLPVNLLWQSPLQVWTGPFSPATVVTVPVPDVVVPDDIALTQTIVSGHVLYLNADLPTTGSTTTHVYRELSDPWTGLTLSFGIGATIYADPVPEPATLSLLGPVGLVVARRRRA